MDADERGKLQIMPKASTSSSLSHRVSSAMLWNSALFPVKLGLALGSGMVLTRVLNKHDFAQYILIASVAALIGTYVDLGMERSVSRFTPEIEVSAGRAGLKKFFAQLFGIKLLFILPVIVAFTLAPDFFIRILALGEDGPILLWGIALLVILGVVADVFVQFLYTHFKQIATNLLDIVASIVQPLLVTGAALLTTGVVGVVAAMVFSSALLDGLAAWRARAGESNSAARWRAAASSLAAFRACVGIEFYCDRDGGIGRTGLCGADLDRDKTTNRCRGVGGGLSLYAIFFAFSGRAAHRHSNAIICAFVRRK